MNGELPENITIAIKPRMEAAKKDIEGMGNSTISLTALSFYMRGITDMMGIYDELRKHECTPPTP